jgi:hypothetical protein
MGSGPLLGQPDRVHHHELGQPGLHLVRQEFQQITGVAHRVDDDYAGSQGRAAQEVDRLDDRLFDQHHPVRCGFS